MSTRLRVTESQLQDLLNEVAFTRKFGFRVQSLGDGECTLSVPFQSDFERPGGVVSGQVFMAVADAAMWLAIMTRLGMEENALTVELKTNFLGAARREDILCTARILKTGTAPDLWRCRMPQPAGQIAHPPHYYLYSPGEQYIDYDDDSSATT